MSSFNRLSSLALSINLIKVSVPILDTFSSLHKASKSEDRKFSSVMWFEKSLEKEMSS